ncbi:MAG TPA: PEP/pyruvate-binding domain-containing protein [Microlunatus sp.]
MSERTVLPLRDVGRDSLAVAGGKGANLGELIKIGMPVPDGFVITTEAYRQLADSAVELRPDFQPAATGSSAPKRSSPSRSTEVDQRQGRHRGDQLRRAWTTVEFPDELRESVLAAYRQLGGGAVAVRSSATAEDLPGAAFAGQQDSYLDIIGEDALVDAVRRCWASLWTDRAIAYRARLAIPESEVAIAVVVQQMAPAAVAGVMFTADPVSGERDKIIIESAPGLGEAVVSGAVTPEHYRLGPDGSLIDHRAGRAGVVVGAAEAAADSGELTERELHRLAELGRSVQDHYGRPMDLEWAIVRDHRDQRLDDPLGVRVRLVQARPMTALPPEAIELSAVQRRTNQVVLDYLPVRPYPLDMTTWTVRGPAEMLTRMAASVGVELDLISGVHQTDGVVDGYRPVTPRPTFKIITAFPSVPRRVRRYGGLQWRQDDRYLRFRRLLDSLSARSPADLGWSELLRHVRTTMTAVDTPTALRVDYLPAAGAALIRLMLILTLLGRRQLLGDLITGAPTITREIDDQLGQLARNLSGHPALSTRLDRADDHLDGDALLRVLRDDPAAADFLSQFDDFLQQYGARETDSPLVVSSPTWVDAPGRVLELIMMLARTEGTAAGSTVDKQAVARRATSRLLRHPWLRRPSVRGRVLRWIDAAQSGVGVREDTHYELLRSLPLLRRALIEIGRRLADAGVIGDAADVWHLRWDEIESLTPPDQLSGPEAARIRTVIQKRSAVREALGSTPLVKIKTTEPGGDALLTGTPASSGRAGGTVRIIRDSNDFGSLRSGEVLVCPYTNPSWTPLFQRASAVVVDTGGPGSHAAIVAREYGIPAVMGTVDGTSRLADGQQVTVDGDHGRVF